MVLEFHCTSSETVCTSTGTNHMHSIIPLELTVTATAIANVQLDPPNESHTTRMIDHDSYL